MDNIILLNVIYVLLQIVIASLVFGDWQDVFGGVSPSYYETNKNKFYEPSLEDLKLSLYVNDYVYNQGYYESYEQNLKEYWNLKKKIADKEQSMDNTDKLREISKSIVNFAFENPDNEPILLGIIEQIQSETLEYGKQLGREETLNELLTMDFMAMSDKEDTYFWDGYAFAIKTIRAKLNQLKEQK